MSAEYRRFESARSSAAAPSSPAADEEAATPASSSALDVDSAAASLPASSSVPPSSAPSRVKHFVRRYWCMSACVLVLVTLGFALLAWRLVMGAKYSAASVENAHLSFDSPPAVPGLQPARRPALSGASVKLLVWNLKKGQEAGLERDLPAYGADRDLLVLSEGLLNAHGRAIFDSMAGVHWEMGVAFRYARETDTPPTGTLLGSTHVLPSWVRVALSEDREPIINTPKCMTMAKYPLTREDSDDAADAADPGSQLLVISIHGVNAVSADALDRQLAQAAGEIRAHIGPVVFAGDFNTNTADKVSRLRRLTTGDLSMREVSYRNDARKTVFGQVIDYVFTRGLRTVDAEVLGSLTSSDHKAMLVELRLE